MLAGSWAGRSVPSVAGMTTSSTARTPGAPATVRHGFAHRHPILAFSLGAFGLGWPLLTATTITGGWGHTPSASPSPGSRCWAPRSSSPG